MQKLSRVLVLSIPTRPPLLMPGLLSAHLRSAAVVASLGWLSGCVLEPAKIDRTPPPDPAIIMHPVAVSASDALQTFLLQAKKMAPAELAIEKEKVRAEFNGEKSEFSRIKLALLLTVPGPSNASAATLAAEDAELAALVDPLASAAGAVASSNSTDSRSSESELKVLALLIQANVQERKRLREQARDALSRAQVARADSTKTEQEARILRTKVEELEKQLAALKSIERSVTSRTKERTDPVPKEGAPK